MVLIYFGDGAGNLTAGPVIDVGNEPHSVITPDFNKDGHLDMAVSNRTDGTVSILLGDGTGNLYQIQDQIRLCAEGDSEGRTSLKTDIYEHASYPLRPTRHTHSHCGSLCRPAQAKLPLRKTKAERFLSTRDLGPKALPNGFTSRGSLLR